MVYVGSVGTGFNERTAHELTRRTRQVESEEATCRIFRPSQNIVWVKPTLVAEVEYRAWTHDGKLRQSSYKGWRDPEENAGIYEIE
ncbi:ATP-dependent DNA ligase [Rhizobium mongolense]|uniref:ATP dependent DNA ligase n=1 Tax=Rhizobium mongolense TaxID=57676 RepID=UPI00355864A2